MIKIRNKKKTGFVDEKANLNNTRFIDDSAILNNVKKSSKKIELDDKFVMPERTDIDKNVFTNKTTTKDYDKYVKSEDTNMDIINDYTKVTTAEKEFKKDYVFLAHENFKYEKRLDEEILKHNPIKILANHFKEAINAFGITASLLSQLNVAQSIAKIIAPVPTPEEIQQIKARLLRLDVTLLTDYYVISQIIQSPELLNFIQSLYQQFEKVVNSPESKYVISLVKHLMDYIVLNQHKFGMPQFLQNIYNKYFGSNANINPNAPVVEPTNAPITFGHDQTQPIAQRITQSPTTINEAPSFNPEQTTSIIKTYYDLAFSDRQQLQLFYLSMTDGTNTIKELDDIASFMRGKTINNITTATLNELITPLIQALNSLTYVDQTVKNEIINKGRNIISSNGFFFQQKQTLDQQQQQPQPQTNIQTQTPSTSSVPSDSSNVPNYYGSQYQSNPDLDYLMNKFNNAFSSNIETLKTLYFQIIDKADPILNKYNELYNTLIRLDKLYDMPVEIAPGKLFIINLFNAFNSIPISTLNDFKQILRAKSDQIMNSPEYAVPGALDITPLEGFVPINYIRPTPQPTTIAKPYDVKPTQQITPSVGPSYVAQPTTGPQIRPTPEPITGGMLGASRLASKIQPSKVRVKITKKQAIKIVETIINNSTNASGLISGVENVQTLFDQLLSQINIERAIEATSIIVGGASLLLSAKKFYFDRKGTREERQRLIGERELLADPELGRDVPVVLNMGTGFGFSAISMTRFLEIVKDANPITLAQHMVNLARNMYRSMSESDLADAVRQGAQNLRNDLSDALGPRLEEVVIDPSVKASEQEGRRRVKEAMEPYQEIDIRARKELDRIKSIKAEGSGLTQEEKEFDQTMTRLDKIKKPQILNKELELVLKQDQSKLHNLVLEELLKKSKEIDLKLTDKQNLEEVIKDQLNKQVEKEVIREKEVIKEVKPGAKLFNLENILSLEKSILLVNHLFSLYERDLEAIEPEKLKFEIFMIYEDYIFPLLINIRNNLDSKLSFLNPKDAIEKSKLLKTYFGLQGSTYIFSNIYPKIQNSFSEFRLKNKQYFSSNSLDSRIIITLLEMIKNLFDRIKVIIPPETKK